MGAYPDIDKLHRYWHDQPSAGALQRTHTSHNHTCIYMHYTVHLLCTTSALQNIWYDA